MDANSPEQPASVTYQTRPSVARRAVRGARNLVLAVAAIGALLALGDWVRDRLTHVYVDDARITADVVSVSSRVSGWVTELRAAEGQRIKTGDILVRIDGRDAELRLAELDARLLAIQSERESNRTSKEMVDSQTRSHYQMRKSQLSAARAALAGRKSDLDLARIDFARVKTLLERKVVSRQRWEEKRTEFRKAGQAHQQAAAEVAAASAALVTSGASRQQLAVLDKQLAMLSHQKQQILAQRDRQALDLGDRIIKSPLNGVVDKVFVNPSEYVSAGQRLLMVHDPEKIWVAANIKETDVRHVRIGAPAILTVDAYPDQLFNGTITRIGSAATSQFALLPTPNPSGNFTKITQRLRMRIDVEQKSHLLRPGMMVEVNIVIDDD